MSFIAFWGNCIGSKHIASSSTDWIKYLLNSLAISVLSVLSLPFMCSSNNGFLCMPSRLESLLMHFQGDELFPPDSAINCSKYAVFTFLISQTTSFLNDLKLRISVCVFVSKYFFKAISLFFISWWTSEFNHGRVALFCLHFNGGVWLWIFFSMVLITISQFLSRSPICNASSQLIFFISFSNLVILLLGMPTTPGLKVWWKLLCKRFFC